jgi:hypothetical protein
LIENRQRLTELEFTNQQLADLRSARLALDDQGKPRSEKNVSRGFDTIALRELSDGLYDILAAWKLPDLGTVEFNEQRMDFLIGGKPRQSNGKGVRALMHSAFVIALMRFCKRKQLPHPGWVLLDSPLTSFRKGDSNSNEEVSGEIQKAFFRSLAETSDAEQIIILENKEPSVEVQKKINYLSFGGELPSSRAGFFIE